MCDALNGSSNYLSGRLLFVNSGTLQYIETMTSLRSDNQDLCWIYIGDKSDAKNLKQLVNKRIKYVMNVTPRKCDGGVSNYHERNAAFIYCRVSVQDNASEDLSLHYDKAWEFFKRAKIREDGNILVHCNLGISRSVALVTSYLMKFQRYSLDDALMLVREARPQGRPNDGFMEQLQKLDAHLRETDAYAPPSPALRCRPVRRDNTGSKCSSSSISASSSSSSCALQHSENGESIARQDGRVRSVGCLPEGPRRIIGPQLMPFYHDKSLQNNVQ